MSLPDKSLLPIAGFGLLSNVQQMKYRLQDILLLQGFDIEVNA